jgi:hypothetical protein
MLLGTYFFGLIGASVRWIFHLLMRLLKITNNRFSFKEMWLGNDKENPENEAGIEMFNNILGMVILFIVAMILI